MTELICVVCALRADAKDATFQWDERNPLASRECPVCKSSATVAVDIFKRFAAARSADKSRPAPVGAANKFVASPLPLSNEQLAAKLERVAAVEQAEKTAKALRETNKWAAHAEAVRSFLKRGSPDMRSAEGWWDGFHFYNQHSWSTDAGSHVPGTLDYVSIVLVNKGGASTTVTIYIDPEDEGMTERS